MRTLSRDRGAIIIHVAFALMALLAFTAFVFDYGVMWVARRQAQNVADAAALAGAVSLIRDGGSEDKARASAQYYADECARADTLLAELDRLAAKRRRKARGKS